MAQSATASTKCDLLELPAELRNRIWHYALESAEITATQARTITTDAQNHIVRVLHDEDGSFQRPPPLLQVNRQIRSEVRPICIALTTFNFDLYLLRKDVASWKKWWKSLGQDVQYVRKIKLTGMRGRFPPRVPETQTIVLHEGRDETTVTVTGSLGGDSSIPGHQSLELRTQHDAQHMQSQIATCLRIFGSGKPDRQLLDRIHGILTRYCERSMFGFRGSLDEVTLTTTRARRTNATYST